MPLLTKAKQRTVISALRDSNVRDIEQNYNEPAKLWCNEKWITAACLRCSDQRCIRYIDAEISCGSFSDFPYERNLNAVSYTHLRAHETDSYLVCRLLLEKKKTKAQNIKKKKKQITT